MGARPLELVQQLEPGALKERLLGCRNQRLRATRFSIGHRGTAFEFPEETAEAMRAGAGMGAGILECDVTFTRDLQLVCRHSPCDLHSTGNILLIPDLAKKCSEPFVPADPATKQAARARCCTTDLELAEFKRLCGKIAGVNPEATRVEDYVRAGGPVAADAPSCCSVLSHDEVPTRPSASTGVARC